MFDRQSSTPTVNVHVLTRSEAQRAVGCYSLHDVLMSLKKSRLVLRFRVTAEEVRIETRSTLAFLVDLHVGSPRHHLEPGSTSRTSLHHDPGGRLGDAA